MRKFFLTRTASLIRTARPGALPTLVVLLAFASVRPATAQDAAQDNDVRYPLSVSTAGEKQPIFVVDLEKPGIWKLAADGSELSLFHQGPQQFRQPLNRPRCILALDAQTVLVGDSATREVYRLAGDGTDPEPLTGGEIGIPMCLALDPAGEMLYVGDAEMRVIVRLPLAGGKPERFAKINARGLGFDEKGDLWALTPDDPAVVKIDGEGAVTPVVTGRPFQYASSLVCSNDQVYVTDGYGHAVMQVTTDGKTSEWFAGEPLQHPVGIAATATAVLVADPHARQVFRFDKEDPQPTPLLPPQP
jgi:hypothetical protein